MTTDQIKSTPETLPRLPDELVHSFVKVAHGDLGAVKALLAQEPRLIHATWDWGGGDFETALGASAHRGQKEIASFLLESGARLDLFAAAMLGEFKIVEATLRAYPTAAHVLGPHRIPLLAHAKAGKADAVVRYLESLKI
ncbi:hypothetical protein [Armatimonas sp.]|uniref:hypothetical protein n=1 Tax=Armatimonas sp. TaxID=1872638 RepID=UPI00286CA18C|nr:hypothetical protein [Armatimonas sp.]